MYGGAGDRISGHCVSRQVLDEGAGPQLLFFDSNGQDASGVRGAKGARGRALLNYHATPHTHMVPLPALDDADMKVFLTAKQRTVFLFRFPSTLGTVRTPALTQANSNLYSHALAAAATLGILSTLVATDIVPANAL